jgi:hypothetical protein
MVVTTGRETRLERRPEPTPRDDQVLVRGSGIRPFLNRAKQEGGTT